MDFIFNLPPSFHQGCFDWWGYSGPSYACKLGPQMVTVANMVKAITNSFEVPPFPAMSGVTES